MNKSIKIVLTQWEAEQLKTEKLIQAIIGGVV